MKCLTQLHEDVLLSKQKFMHPVSLSSFMAFKMLGACGNCKL